MPVCAQYQSLAPPSSNCSFRRKAGKGRKEKRERATLFLCCVTYTQAHDASRHGTEGGKPGRHPRGSVISSLLFTSLVRASHTRLHTCTTIPCHAVLESFVAFTRQTSNTARVEKKKSSVGQTGVVGVHRSPWSNNRKKRIPRPKRRLEKKVVIERT